MLGAVDWSILPPLGLRQQAQRLPWEQGCSPLHRHRICAPVLCPYNRVDLFSANGGDLADFGTYPCLLKGRQTIQPWNYFLPADLHFLAGSRGHAVTSLFFDHTMHARGSVNNRHSVPPRDARRCRGRAGKALSCRGQPSPGPGLGAGPGPGCGAELPAAFPSWCRPLAGWEAGKRCWGSLGNLIPVEEGKTK